MKGDKIDIVFIGSRPNSRTGDLRVAASVVKEHRKADGVDVLVAAEISPEYSDVAVEYRFVVRAAMQLILQPERFVTQAVEWALQTELQTKDLNPDFYYSMSDVGDMIREFIPHRNRSADAEMYNAAIGSRR